MPAKNHIQLALLGVLYFVQGIPSGFQNSTLPLILRKEGLSYTNLGFMKLILIPWICKPLYAPFIDNNKTKKFWLILMLSILATICYLIGVQVDIRDIPSLSISFLVLNVFAVAYNVALDSLTVETLALMKNIGFGNTVQVVGFKSGTILSGGLFLKLYDKVGWSMMFYMLSIVYLICIVMVVSSQKVSNASKTGDRTESETRPGFIEIFKKIITLTGISEMVAFVLLYKLCERSFMTFSMFLVDKQVPVDLLANWSFVMNVTSFVGSLYAGYSISKGTPPKNLLMRYSWLRASGISFLYLIIVNWDDGQEHAFEYLSPNWIATQFGLLILCFVGFCAGILTSAIFAIMMTFCQTACDDGFKATLYTSLAAFEGGGKLFFATGSGYLLDNLGLETTFLIFVLMSVLIMPLVSRLPDSQSNV